MPCLTSQLLSCLPRSTICDLRQPSQPSQPIQPSPRPSTLSTLYLTTPQAMPCVLPPPSCALSTTSTPPSHTTSQLDCLSLAPTLHVALCTGRRPACVHSPWIRNVRHLHTVCAMGMGVRAIFNGILDSLLMFTQGGFFSSPFRHPRSRMHAEHAPAYSVVTLLAKLRGKSTSMPFMVARW